MSFLRHFGFIMSYLIAKNAKFVRNLHGIYAKFKFAIEDFVIFCRFFVKIVSQLRRFGKIRKIATQKSAYTTTPLPF